LETLISVLNSVTCFRREIPIKLIAVAYHPTLIVAEILPLLETILRLRLLAPIHLQPARRARRYLFLSSSVHLLPTVSMIGQKILLVIGHIVPSDAIRMGNPYECKCACD
jgi:hypothetical protein